MKDKKGKLRSINPNCLDLGSYCYTTKYGYVAVAWLHENDPQILWDYIHTKGRGKSLAAKVYYDLKQKISKINPDAVDFVAKERVRIRMERAQRKALKRFMDGKGKWKSLGLREKR